VDISRTGETVDTFMAFYKWIDQATIDAYATAGIPLLDLQGRVVTQVGWVDFTKQVPGGDGVTIGQSGDGNILFLDYTITDNSLGDNDLTVGRITDPGIPVFFERTVDVVAKTDVAEGSTAVFSVTLSVPKSTSTEVRLSLADGLGSDGTDSLNGQSLDYSPQLLAYYFDTNGNQQFLPVNAGIVVLPPRLTSFFVSVATLDDPSLEGAEQFTLTATLIGGGATDSANAVIIDNGSGTIYRPDGTPDPNGIPNDDRSLNVSSVSVNEASPYAVFSVSGGAGQQLRLSLADQNSDGANLSGIQVFNGTSWISYAPDSIVSLSSSGSLLVRVAINAEQEGILDGPETFSLVALNTGDQSFKGTGTINDDGTGGYFAADNNTATPTTPAGIRVDDDRTLIVTAFGPVNEASPYAMFTVAATPGQALALALGNTSSPLEVDATIGGFGLEWSADGNTWNHSPTVPVVPGSGLVFVRVDISSEADDSLEGPETFTLTATYTSGAARSATGISTIIDNGTGSLYGGGFSNGAPAPLNGPLDDDKSFLSIPDVDVNEASPYVVFRVIASGGQVFSLGLSDGGTGFTAANDDATERNRQRAVVNADYLNQLEVYDGRIWNPYAPGSSIRIPSGGSVLLVRVPLINDPVDEGAHAFTLTAIPTSGNSTSGRAIIGDFGTGAIFNDSGAENRRAIKDDDRLLRVNSPIVNEGSELVLFHVTGITGPVQLSLQDIAGSTGFATLTNPAIQYWTGTAWAAYAGTPIAPGTNFMAGTELQVRVAIGEEQDNLREGSERFTLIVDGAGGPSFGVATIRDDGTGLIWLADNLSAATEAELSAAQRRLDDDFDLDGITPTTEEALATLAASQGIAGAPGDLNGDGLPDALQNALATLAWRDVASFNAGNEGTLTDVRPIISLKALDAASGNTVSTNLQLENIRVVDYTDPQFGSATDAVSIDQASGTRTVELATGGTVTTPWDPIRFELTPLAGTTQLTDLYPSRSGVQVRMFIDMRAAALDPATFNAYIKFVSAATITAAAPSGGLVDLDGNAITTEGWYNFSQRVPDGDGARFIIENGKISGIELIITDNSFGDNDLQADRIFDPGAPVLLPQELAVSSVTVNEASPYAVFSVSGAAAQQLRLSLADQNGDGANLSTIQVFDGITWQTYSAGSLVALDATGSRLVRVALSPEQETALDGPEPFSLVATNLSGTAFKGSGTIRDDGSGGYFTATNNSAFSSIPAGILLDDDRPLTVSSLRVNEASPHATFQISGSVAQSITALSFADGTATGGVDFDPQLEYFDPITGGGTWRTYSPGVPTRLDAAGNLLVRTRLVDDRIYEGAETLFLNASNSGGAVATGQATIIDDGTGSFFNNDGSLNPTAARDDDRPLPPPIAALPALRLEEALCIEQLFASQGLPGLMSFLSQGDITPNRVANVLGWF